MNLQASHRCCVVSSAARATTQPSLPAPPAGSTWNAIQALKCLTALKNGGLNIVASSNSWGCGPYCGYDETLVAAITSGYAAGILVSRWAAGMPQCTRAGSMHWYSHRRTRQAWQAVCCCVPTSALPHPFMPPIVYCCGRQ